MWTFYRTHALLVRALLLVSIVLVGSTLFLPKAEASHRLTSPTLTLTAYPTEVQNNGLALLVWKASNATNCTLSDGSQTGSVARSGSSITPALTKTTTYTLSCMQSGKTVSKSTTITVQGAGVTWTFCGTEGTTCTFTGTREVRFGITGKVVTKVMTGPITCTAANFGVTKNVYEDL